LQLVRALYLCLVDSIERVLKGKIGTWALPILALAKWDLRHLGWDLATGNGEEVAYNWNRKDVL